MRKLSNRRILITGFYLLIAPALGWAEPDIPDMWNSSPLRKPMPDFARKSPEQPEPALPFNAKLRFAVPNSIKEELRGTFANALSIVQSFPPEEDNLFAWRGDRGVLEGKDFVFFITRSDDPIFRTNSRAAAQLGPDNESGTFIDYSPDGEYAEIVAFALVDRFYLDEKGNRRPDADLRAIMALAREFYGNVQAYLKMNIGEIISRTADSKQQIESHRAVMNFLERMIQSEAFKRAQDSEQKALLDALEKERKLLSDRRDNL